MFHIAEVLVDLTDAPPLEKKIWPERKDAVDGPPPTESKGKGKGKGKKIAVRVKHLHLQFPILLFGEPFVQRKH